MKKLPTYAGILIFFSALLINWLSPSLAKMLNAFFIWTLLAYTIYYWIRYWLYVRKQR